MSRQPRPADPAATAINWRWHRWSELSTDLLYQLLQLRTAIFVVEQNCVFQDMDGLDARSEHLCGFDTEGVLVAYARLLPPELKYVEASIGRVIVAESQRRSGLGRLLMAQALEGTLARFPDHAIRIGAQHRLERFYRDFGFDSTGEPYLEDGIWHIDMLRRPGTPR
ncbi:MAG: hypothetical protein JWR16_1334 [Nevskia sp.]|nr:hypothetical protein [Nevskia sp.]